MLVNLSQGESESHFSKYAVPQLSLEIITMEGFLGMFFLGVYEYTYICSSISLCIYNLCIHTLKI